MLFVRRKTQYRAGATTATRASPECDDRTSLHDRGTDERREGADARLQDPHERECERDDGDRRGDERRTGPNLVHSHVLPEHRRHDADSGAAEDAPGECHPADLAEPVVGPQRRDPPGHALPHERLGIRLVAQFGRHDCEDRERDEIEHADSDQHGGRSAEVEEKQADEGGAEQCGLVHGRADRVGAEEAVTLRRVGEAAEDRSFGEVARDADDDGRDEDEHEPVLSRERGQRIEGAGHERDRGDGADQSQRWGGVRPGAGRQSRDEQRHVDEGAGEGGDLGGAAAIEQHPGEHEHELTLHGGGEAVRADQRQRAPRRVSPGCDRDAHVALTAAQRASASRSRLSACAAPPKTSRA